MFSDINHIPTIFWHEYLSLYRRITITTDCIECAVIRRDGVNLDSDWHIHHGVYDRIWSTITTERCRRREVYL